MFSLLDARHKLFLLLPAIFASLLSGAVAPFMTYVVGKAFDAFVPIRSFKAWQLRQIKIVY